MKRNVVIIMLFFAQFTACEKDEKLTKKEMIQGKEWIVSEMTIDPGIDFGDGVITDLLSVMNECEKDDIYSFYEGGNFAIDKAANHCYEGEPQIETGEWTLNDEEIILTVTMIVDGAPEVKEYELIEVSSTKIVGKMAVNFYGMSLTPTITFINK